jgi:hypothetical protein
LRRDPLAIAAVDALGINAQYRGDTTAAKRWFDYAERLSRRDLRSQLWAIENAVDNNDLPEALRHYDTALRASTSAAKILFPVLQSAISDAAVRAVLVRTLADKPGWGEQFISESAGSGTDPEAAALLFLDVSRAGGKIPARAQMLVIARLIEANKVDAAWAYYAATRPEVRRNLSRNPRFAGDIAEPTAFDWQPSDDAGLSVSVQQGLVDFNAAPSIGGILVRQLQVLPAGDYVLDGRSAGIDQPRTTLPYWTLTCLGGRELGRVQLTNSAEGNGRFAGHFTVPADCSSQILSLNAEPSDEAGGLTGQIFEASLRPTG